MINKCFYEYCIRGYDNIFNLEVMLIIILVYFDNLRDVYSALVCVASYATTPMLLVELLLHFFLFLIFL